MVEAFAVFGRVVRLLLGAMLAVESSRAVEFAGDYPFWTVRTGQIGVNPQLWAVEELPNGVMAFGSADGLLLYDGEDWLPVTFANQYAARSLAVSARGTLHVGGVGDLAILELASADGSPRLLSLLRELPEDRRSLSTVIQAVASGEVVCFRAGPRVLCREEGRLREYVAEGGFVALTAGAGRFFAVAETLGLVRLVPGGEVRPVLWPEDAGVGFSSAGLRGLVALDGRDLIARDAGERLLRLRLDADGFAVERVHPWGGSVRGRINRMRPVAGGKLLLTTFDQGAYLIDGEGRIELHVGPRAGLASPLVTDGMIDSRGVLWLTQDGGISRIDLRSSFREWPTSGELGGRPLAVLPTADALLVGTTQGLMRLDAAGWQRVEPLAMQTLMLAEASIGQSRQILAANAEGLYRIGTSGTLEPILSKGRAASILPSPLRQDRLFVGHSLGVLEAEWVGERWQLRQQLHGPVGHVRDIAELQDGTLIAIEAGVAVWRFRRGGDGTFLPGERLAAQEGVSDASNATLIFDGSAWLLSLPGAVLALAAEGSLRRDGRWSAALRDSEERIAQLATVRAGRWFVLLDRPGRVWAEEWIEEDGGRIRRLRELPGSDRRELTGVFYDRFRHLVWFVGAAALYSFDPERPEPAAFPPRLLLREVRRADGALLGAWLSAPGPSKEGGTFGAGHAPGSSPPLVLPAHLADLSFRFSAPGAAPPDRIAFSYRLVGLHDGWSDFLLQSSRAYNTLPAGRYRFELRARDPDGRVSPVLSYAFSVAPPWFLHPGAQVAYVLAALWLLYLASRVGARVARQRAERLERLVAERTAALAEANARLERAAFTDPLTDLWNRRVLSIEAQKCGQLRRPDGVLLQPRQGWLIALVDLDHFKAINDRFGHAAGDEVLIEAARRLRAVAREEDWILRWGGEEFLCLVPLDQPIAEEELARRWLGAIATQPFVTALGPIAVTASIGLAHFPLDPAHPERFDLEASIQAADEALYRAKVTGRGRAVTLRWRATREEDARGRRLEEASVVLSR